MVYNDLLFHVHLRLTEIFGSVNDQPFAGVSVIAVGDFFQLPPLGGKPLYVNYKDKWQNFDSLWKIFKIFELTKVMRQCGDSQLIYLSNNVRAGEIQPDNINIPKSRVIQPGAEDYPQNALHIFAENAIANRHNDKMLNTNENNLFSEKAIDNLPQHIAQDKTEKLLKKSKSTLHIKLNARVMLTINVDLQDRLVSGQLGTVKHIVLNSQNNVSKIYIKFDDCKAGL